MAATSLLADFVVAARPLPDACREVAARSRLDTLCASVAGAVTPSGAAVTGLADELGTPRGSWGAWRSAALAHASGMDDTACYGAAGAPVWGALLAVTEDDHHDHGDRDRLLDAFGVGVHAAAALWRAGNYREAERGFAGTSVFGTIAATAACSVLLGLGRAQVVAALAVAASSTGGLIANHGTTAAVTHAATAARDGLTAARLAARDYQGATDILEARQGFGEAFFGLGRAGLEDLDRHLQQPVPLEAEIRAKLVPGHADHQRVVRAATMLGARGTIRRFTVDGVPAASEGTRFDVPVTADEARYSLRYVLACVLRSGRPGLADFTPERVADPAVREAMDRVRIALAPRWAPGGAEAGTVTAEYADGATRSVAVAGLPVTANAGELATKWRAASKLVSDGTLDGYIDCMDQYSTVKR
ncbi:MAG: hypothetical protein GEV28_04070 [Actinophytocola sp.]|uniref:MmgE/PrpD family protein n=1 Tax=Actinophytocola sp. TaxID=1872138 RepID=UPI0013220635|nr:MmgE/PrpD family protein [Actinophytocola sp.]MPZ79606.1 hypothetical protein [Actinophytocola sp.]